MGASEGDLRARSRGRSYAALVLLVLLLAGCGHRAPKAVDAPEKDGPVPTVTVAVAQRRPMVRTLPLSGVLQNLPGKEAVVTPPVAGVLESLSVRYGQQVAKGQIIGHIGDSQVRAQIRQAQATLGQNLAQVQQAEANAMQQQAQTSTGILQAKAGVRNAMAALAGAEATLTGDEAATRNARQTLSRQQALFADGLVAQKDVEAAALALRTAQAAEDAQRQVVDGQKQTISGQQQAVAAARAAALQDVVKRKDIQVAEQQVSNARAALQAARAQLALYTLRAPLAGRVTLMGATPGVAVDTTAKVVTIADLRTLQLQINVPSESASAVRPGQDIQFTVANLPGRTFTATVRTISPQIDAATGTLPAYAEVPNPNGILKDDTTVKAQVVVDRRLNSVTVPQSAVLADPQSGDKTVAVIGNDGALHVTPVETGLTAGGRVEILKGLSPGQSVAVTGQFGVPDGAKVNVQTSEVKKEARGDLPLVATAPFPLPKGRVEDGKRNRLRSSSSALSFGKGVEPKRDGIGLEPLSSGAGLGSDTHVA